MKKIILPGVIAGVVTLVISMVVSSLFRTLPQVSADYSSAGIMRPWVDPLMMFFFLYPFVQGIIFAWAWNKIKTLFEGATLKRGLKFGLSLWFVAGLTGMFVTYTTFPLSLLTVLSWAVGGLVSAIIAGMIFARMNG